MANEEPTQEVTFVPNEDAIMWRGRKYVAAERLEQAEARLRGVERAKDIIGSVLLDLAK